MKEIGIAKVISFKRHEMGITQEELAEFMGVTKASVSKWETGLSYPDIEILPRLAAYFNISVDELLNYTPQLTKEEIKRLYHELAKKFADIPFGEARKECNMLIKKYYSCFPLLLQMVILYINHHMIAGSKEEALSIIEEARLLCERIKNESEDMDLSNQALHMEAVIYQLLGMPEQILELLGEEIKPKLSSDSLIISAFQMKGNIQNARKLSQINMYNNLSEIVAMMSGYLRLYTDEQDKTDEIIDRTCKLIKLFKLESIQANSSVVFYYQAAITLINHGKKEKALNMLEKYTQVCINQLDNFSLHGDEFFDLLDIWFKEFDLGNSAPRSQKAVNKDMLEGLLNTPAFEGLQEEESFKEMVRELRKIV